MYNNMKSKTLIEKQAKRKLNPELVETIIKAKKSGWLEVASLLSRPKRKKMDANLFEINKKAKDGETIVVPGKVLSEGEIEKRIKIIAFSFSKTAEEKLKRDKVEYSTIKQEIEKNPKQKTIIFVK